MNVVLKSLIGSHNYNLNTENSDKDYKIFYVPNFDELYNSTLKSKTTKENGNDIEYHDIRRLPEFLKKANINFIEVLFSTEIEIESHLSVIVYEMRDDLARMNLPYLYNSSIGAAISRYKDYQKLKEKGEIEKANKQLSNAIRMLNFIIRFGNRNFADFKDSIYYQNSNVFRDVLLQIKNGEIDGEVIYKDMLQEAELWKNTYMKYEFNEDIYNKFENAIKNLVKLYLINELY